MAKISKCIFKIRQHLIIFFRWSVVGKMEEPRFSMGTVAYDGLIYLVGGCTHTRRHMQELVSYNPVTITFTIHCDNRFIKSNDYLLKILVTSYQIDVHRIIVF